MSATIDELAARLLSDAADVDAADALPAEHLRGLARAGLFGIFAPVAEGGLGLSRPETWPVVEELASACLATAFVWIQHFGLLEALLDPAAPAELRAELLPGTVRGEVRGGLALAGLLPGPPRLTATPVASGWRLDGQAPWVTGWGAVNLLLVAARGPQDSVVRLLVEARDQPGLAAARQRLAAANASATVRLTFDGLVVPEERYVGRRPFDPVRQQSEGLRSNGSLALGVARRCARLLGPGPLDDELAACRDRLDAAVEAGPAPMAAARAAASELAVRAAAALTVRDGAGAITVDAHAQRLAREALFLLVFGSRPAIKSELAALLGRGGSAP